MSLHDDIQPSALQSRIDAAFAGVPAAHHNAIYGYKRTDGTWVFTIARRQGEHFDFGATFEKARAKGWVTEFQFRSSW